MSILLNEFYNLAEWGLVIIELLKFGDSVHGVHCTASVCNVQAGGFPSIISYSNFVLRHFLYRLPKEEFNQLANVSLLSIQKVGALGPERESDHMVKTVRAHSTQKGPYQGSALCSLSLCAEV